MRPVLLAIALELGVPAVMATSEPSLPTNAGAALTAWTTQDVIDPRIDEYAHYALMRMLTHGVEGVVASDILSAVKQNTSAASFFRCRKRSSPPAAATARVAPGSAS